jgi:CRISPR-associated protein Csm3
MAGLVSKPDEVDMIFGKGIEPGKPSTGPTRIGIRDAFPTREWRERMIDSDFYDGGLELKGENWIQPSGVAKPRLIQRVIPDVEFDVDIILSLYSNDDEGRFIQILKSSIEALEDSYLGGSGTRGYGRVEFDIDFDNPVRKGPQYYLDKK